MTTTTQATAADVLAETLAVFRRWLHLPDPGLVELVLGAVAANRMPGDPVWLLVVGPPGAGKSELLQSVGRLPDVHPAATLTEPALLSGTPKKERSSESKGGLLRVIGDFGILLCKDFGSVLSMHREARSAVLAALREVYDGSWTRHVGADGGRTLHWQGKVGLLAGCTPSIDSHSAVMGSMGERFVLYRLPPVDENEQATRALAHAGSETVMREELTAAVTRLFAAVALPAAPQALSLGERQRLVELSMLAVRCRSSVERDGYSREVELIPQPEAPGRLALVLGRLLGGMTAVGVERSEAWRLVAEVALDSMPALRRTFLEVLVKANQPQATGDLAAAAGYPTSTARRGLEDLTAHGVLVRASQGGNRPDLWSVSEWTRQRWAVCFPEVSAGQRNGSVPEVSDGECSWGL